MFTWAPATLGYSGHALSSGSSYPTSAHSGKVREFPEIDRVGWFSVAEANVKLLKGQRPLLDRLMAALEGAEPDGSR